MKGRIIAEVKKGRFKGKKIDIELGNTAIDSTIKVNGKSITNITKAVHIHARADEPTNKLVIELACCLDEKDVKLE